MGIVVVAPLAASAVVDLPAHQIGRQLRQAIDLLGPAVVDRHVLALDVAGFFEALAKGTQALGNRLVRSDFEKADHRQCRLLCARRERPRRHAAEQHDEVAPSHSITSSARASSVGGTSRPIPFAVARLMTRSNLVGSSDRQVAGFLTFENPADVDAGTAIGIGLAWSIAHQPAGLDVLAMHIARGQRVAGHSRDQLSTLAIEERTTADEQRAGAHLHDGREGGIEFAFTCGLHDPDLPTDSATRLLHGSRL
jgi:hypothetical protein